MNRCIVFAACFVSLAACKSPFARYCTSNADCSDPAYPVCDTTGASAESGGHGNICVSGSADAGAVDADESSPPETPALLAPANGAFTGSNFAEASRRPTLRWLPAERAVTYDVQIEDTCAVPDFQSCAFESPELSDEGVAATVYRPSTPLATRFLHPVGRRYFWRVRGCNAAGCSPWSAIRYANVGRQVNDFGGTGYADRVAGRAPESGASVQVGAAYVYQGQASVASVRESADLVVPDPTALDSGGFGRAVAPVGDVNGDGYSDFVVGAERHSACGGVFGAAYLYLGGPSMTGAPSTILGHPQAQENGGTECTARFGLAVAGGGDVNGDGFADVLVAAPESVASSTRPGRVFVYLGRPSWPASLDLADILLTDPAGALNGSFGLAVSMSGDLDGDGFADIVIGAASTGRPEPSEGNVYIYRGRTNWGSLPAVVDTPDVLLDNPEDATMAFFGAFVTSEGDLDDDGYADLVVAAPFRSGTHLVGGVAFLYRGRPVWPTLLETADSTLENPSGSDYANFGSSVSSGGDVNGDGVADLAVGASTKDFAGESFVFFGRSTWPATLSVADVALANGASVAVGQFGAAVSVLGDMNGDGISDLAVGAPRTGKPEIGEGNVLLWLGRTAWPASSTIPSVTLDAPDDVVEGQFGIAVR
jgi:hypothetical protein